MTDKQKFDSKPYDSLFKEVMAKSLSIQSSINRHLQSFEDISPEKMDVLRSRFWNEYVYPSFEPVYYEMFGTVKKSMKSTEHMKVASQQMRAEQEKSFEWGMVSERRVDFE